MDGLFLFLLLFAFDPGVPLSIDDANCPETQACLQMNFCDDQINSISYLESKVKSDIGCSSSSLKPSWTAFHFEPKFEREWLIEIYSTRATKEFIVSFENKLLKITNKSVSDVAGILEPGQHFQTKNFQCIESENITFVTFKLSSAKSIYDQFMNGEIQSAFHTGLVLEAKENKKFKKKVFDLLHPCDNSQLNDACETGQSCVKISGNSYKAKCSAILWVNYGSSTNPEYRSVEGIACQMESWSVLNDTSPLKNRETLCSIQDPNQARTEKIISDSYFCDHRKLKEFCDGGTCSLRMGCNSVSCPTKLWIDRGNAFIRNWLAVDRIICQNGSWNWKEVNVTEHSIGDNEVSCSTTSPSEATSLFYAIIGVSFGLLLILIVVCFLWKARCISRSKTLLSTVKTNTSSDLGSLPLAAADASKAEEWNWPEETDAVASRPVETPSSAPQPEPSSDAPNPSATPIKRVAELSTKKSSRKSRRTKAPSRKDAPKKPIRDTQFINVTESTTKQSSRETRQQKKSTRKAPKKATRDNQFINVTESPTRHSSKEIRHQKKSARKVWMTESPTKKEMKGSNKPARDTQFINVTESPTRHSSREIGRQKKVKR